MRRATPMPPRGGLGFQVRCKTSARIYSRQVWPTFNHQQMGFSRTHNQFQPSAQSPKATLLHHITLHSALAFQCNPRDRSPIHHHGLDTSDIKWLLSDGPNKAKPGSFGDAQIDECCDWPAQVAVPSSPDWYWSRFLWQAVLYVNLNLLLE